MDDDTSPLSDIASSDDHDTSDHSTVPRASIELGELQQDIAEHHNNIEETTSEENKTLIDRQDHDACHADLRVQLAETQRKLDEALECNKQLELSHETATKSANKKHANEVKKLKRENQKLKKDLAKQRRQASRQPTQRSDRVVQEREELRARVNELTDVRMVLDKNVQDLSSSLHKLHRLAGAYYPLRFEMGLAWEFIDNGIVTVAQGMNIEYSGLHGSETLASRSPTFVTYAERVSPD